MMSENRKRMRCKTQNHLHILKNTCKQKYTQFTGQTNEGIHVKPIIMVTYGGRQMGEQIGDKRE